MPIHIKIMVSVIPLIVGAVFYYLESGAGQANVATVGGGIAFSALGIILAEQVYRNAPFDARSSLKYFSLGIGGMFVYDFVVFGWTVINGEMGTSHWAARGSVTALFAVPLGLAAKRSTRLTLDARVPRLRHFLHDHGRHALPVVFRLFRLDPLDGRRQRPPLGVLVPVFRL